jgi:ATP-binding cassette subfamily C protein CydCD
MYFDWRLAQLTAGVRARIALAAALGLGETAAGVARLGLVGAALALIFQQRPAQDMVAPVAVIAVLALLRAAFHVGKQILSEETATLMKVKLRRMLYAHLLVLGPGYLQKRRTGELLMTCVDGVEQLQSFFGQFIPQLIVSVVAPVAIFGFMLALDPPSAFIFLGFALFTLIAPTSFRQALAKTSRSRRRAWAAMGAEFLDTVQGLATLKVFAQSAGRRRVLGEKIWDVFRATMQVLRVSLAGNGIATFGVAAGASTVLGYGAVRVASGELALGPLLVVLFLGVEIFRPLRELSQIYHQGVMATSAAMGIFALLEEQPEVVDARGASTVESLEPTVQFEDVSFAYAGGTRPALNGLSFALPAGRSLALVGPSGAGKSTAVWLLMRFFDPQGGRVLLGGRDVREVPLETLRRQIAVVAQDTYLFHGTVRENLQLGQPDATDDALLDACRTANAHEFIARLPQGYDTIIGERGIKLSGGQRQRLAIARAVLKDAPILILDEATSSVDAENEAVIHEALERLMRHRTTLIIAHRLSTVVGTDEIVVLDEGRRVEAGTHGALVAAGGAYARLVAAQTATAPSPEAPVASATGTAANGYAPNGHVVPPAPIETAARAAAAAAVADALPPQERSPEAAPLGFWRTGLRLMGLIRKQWWELAITLVGGIGRASATIALGAASAVLVAHVARREDIGGALAILVALSLLVPVLTWFESWISHDLAYRLLAQMRLDMYRRLDPLAPAYLVHRRSGDLTSIVSTDIELVESFFAHGIVPFFVAASVPLVALGALAVLSWPLALALLPFVILTALSPKYVGLRTEHLGVELRRQMGEVNAHFAESVEGLREVVSFSENARRLAAIEARSRSLVGYQLRFGRQMGIQNGVVEALQALGGLAVMVAGAWLVAGGAFTRTSLPLATMLAFSAFGPVADVSRLGKRLMETFAAARRVLAVYDQRPVVSDGAGVAAERPLAPHVRFEDVTFRYEPGLRPALRNVSIDVGPGQTVAVVGRSGAGKTTAAHLLLRFWDPEAGRILVGGQDVRMFALDDLRRRMAFVSQDTYLFNTTIRENLRLGRPEAGDAEVETAARRANAHDFIAKLPQGYDTVVGERGMQFSGGQRQRLAIARALLLDAPILVLDEAMSHLDAASEQEVRGAIAELMAGRTTILIAHRLSTVRGADQIVVLEEGQVIEDGRHHDLLDRNGVYAQLIGGQLQTPAPAAPTAGPLRPVYAAPVS